MTGLSVTKACCLARARGQETGSAIAAWDCQISTWIAVWDIADAGQGENHGANK